MILILSTDSDYSTKEVMQWLMRWKVPVIRLNDNDVFRYPLRFKIGKALTFEININKKWISSENINVVWFRKFGFFDQYEGYSELKKNLGIDYCYRVSAEQRKILNLIARTLKTKHWLCKYSAAGLNKFDVLQKALEVGLNTPYSIITNSKHELLSDPSLAKRCIITKGAGDIMYVDLDETTLLTTLTTDITKYTNELPNLFFPSLIQNKIQKQFELRVFYLDGKTYSMAIFSQRNKQTETDFRNYDRKTPNRWVPYQLPLTIEEKVTNLMNLLDLNTGSLDFLYTVNGEYIFLEVNPAGQFGMVSSPCNYNLEKEVAKYLSEQNSKHETHKGKAKIY